MKITRPAERRPGTLRLPPSRHPAPTRTRLRTRRLPLPLYATILLVLPVAVLLGARASGWWITSGHTVPATALGAQALGVDSAIGNGRGATDSGSGSADGGSRTETGTGGGAQADAASAPTASAPGGSGTLDPGDVKGSMTLRQLLDAFPKVTAAEICGKFGVPADTPTSTQLKTLAQQGNGYDVSQLREWLEKHAGGS